MRLEASSAEIAVRWRLSSLRIETPRGQRSGSLALAPAERRVVTLVLTGATNQQISESLHVSIPTIETHLAHVFDKMEVRNRTGLAALLFQTTGRAG